MNKYRIVVHPRGYVIQRKEGWSWSDVGNSLVDMEGNNISLPQVFKTFDEALNKVLELKTIDENPPRKPGTVVWTDE